MKLFFCCNIAIGFKICWCLIPAERRNSVPLPSYLFGRGHEVYAFSCIYLRILVSKHNFHIKVCSCLLRVARQVTLLEQELVALPGHMNSPQYFVDNVSQSSVFCVMFCGSLLVSFSLFIWTFHSLSFDLRLLITCLVYLDFPDRNDVHQ